ncbi:MAG: hypothetical protein KIS68_16095 [Bauldia sp.]|nr:hypothetical protein [Bauldia sp.]
MAAWFLHDNAAYGYEGTKLVVSFDGVSRSYWIWETVFNDGSSLLDVRGHTDSAFIDLFGAANDIRVITPWREFRLPSTPEAMADRAEFARACAG